MHSRKRLLLVIPNLDFGGAQNSFARVSHLLNPYVDLLLIVFNTDNIAPWTFGAPLKALNVPASGTLFSKSINFFKRVKRLKEIKKEFKPDVSVSFLEGADYVNLLSSVGERVLFYVHGSKTHDPNIRGALGWLRINILIPRLYARADGILVVNERLKEELKTVFGLATSTYRFVPNFCNVEELEAASEAEVPEPFTQVFEKFPTVVIAGRLSHEKGIDQFIPIFRRLRDKVPTAKLILVGEGPLRDAIVLNCKKEGLEFSAGAEYSEAVSVFFTGFQKNPYRFMKRASLLALPSITEGMPNAIMESLCLGIPVVASDCPYGPRELLTKNGKAAPGRWPEYAEYGILAPIPRSDSGAGDAWVEALGRLISDKELRKKYSEAAKLKSNSFSEKQVLATWIDLLNR